MSQYEKIAINFTKEEKEKLDEIVAREQGVTRSDLVREAVDYYLGYYVHRESMNYISPIIHCNIDVFTESRAKEYI